MKKFSVRTLALIMALLMCVGVLCACGNKEPDSKAVATAIYQSIGDKGMLDVPDDYVTDIMGIELTGYASRNAMINIENGNEYGLFRGGNEEQTAQLKSALEIYIDYRLSTDDSDMIKNAEVWSEGNYVLYAFVSDDVRPAVKDAFLSCFD